jgi:hypothetical protein
MARATTSQGCTPPTGRDDDHGSYIINDILPMTVDLR